MSRTHKIVAAVVAVALVAAGAFAVVWWQGSAERDARALAQRIADQASRGALDNAGFHVTAGVDPAAEYATITRGIAAKPAVTVGDVRLGPDRASAKAVLHYRWPLLAGHPDWEYDATVTLSTAGSPGGAWRASWAPTVVAPGLAGDERLRGRRLLPTRGAIVGARDARMAYNQPATRVGVDKTTVDAAAAVAAARRLASVVGLDAERYATRVQKAGPKAYVEAAVLRDNDPTQAAQAEKAVAIEGVRPIKTVRPLGLTPSFARPILGVVGEATPEIIEKSQGAVAAGDIVGLTGLQSRRDNVLRGSAGYQVLAELRDRPGTGRELYGVEQTDGRDLALSIDVGLQQAAEAVLGPVKPASAIVAIRPSDGAVLAAASGQGGGGYSTATLGQYAPGSTFKTVSGLAMLRAGIAPGSRVACTPSITVEGMRFDNFQGYPASALGSVPFSTAFAHSCNAAFISNRDKVSQADLRAAGDALGLNVAPDLVVPGVLGEVPGDAPTVEHAASMIGQGKVLASPLGMATVAASIAKGEAVRPWLVEGEQPDAVAAPARPLTASEAGQLRSLMSGVVTTGGATFLQGTPGGQVIAKTGTASYGAAPVRFHGWMIAIQGDLAVAVFVEDGESGAKTAGPLLKQFLTRAAALR